MPPSAGGGRSAARTTSAGGPGSFSRRSSPLRAEFATSTFRLIDLVIRALGLGAFVVAAAIALTHMAVRRGGLAPFGRWPRFVRRLTDPLLHAVERRVAAAGQNPQDAPLWLLGAVAVIGLLAITLTRWIFGTILMFRDVRSSGPAVWVSLLVAGASWVLMTAILVRVIGLWMGFGRYHRVMRHLYTMTDWLIEPIRRRLPAMRVLDLSPFIAYMAVWIVREVLLALLR